MAGDEFRLEWPDEAPRDQRRLRATDGPAATLEWAEPVDVDNASKRSGSDEARFRVRLRRKDGVAAHQYPEERATSPDEIIASLRKEIVALRRELDECRGSQDVD